MLNAPLGSKYTQPKSPHCTLTRPLEKIFLGSAEVDPTMLIGFFKKRSRFIPISQSDHLGGHHKAALDEAAMATTTA